MKQYHSVLILCIVFVIVLAGAFLGYRYLSENYDPSNTVSDPQTNASDAEHTDSAENEHPSASDNKDTAWDFTVYDIDGKPITLFDSIDRPVMISFFASWCSPCKLELHNLEKIYAEYLDHVSFMVINMTDGYRETIATAAAFLKNEGFTFPTYYDLDRDAAIAYGVIYLPTTVLIDQNKKIVSTHIGYLDEQTMRNMLDALASNDDR
ncbi:MAG: TlpA family protein disulfide reductase [Clostridia bacterium]|nr:TlpA family protein disulfide reductase [Clostridia bacterium]